MPRGTTGRLSTTECTYVPTYVPTSLRTYLPTYLPTFTNPRPVALLVWFLRLRALHTFGLSVLDYISGASSSPPTSCTPLNALPTMYAGRPTASSHGSTDLCSAFPSLPFPSRPIASPDVALHSHLHLLITYLGASWSTNMLAVAGSHHLRSLPVQAEWQPKGLCLRLLPHPVRIELHACPNPALHDAPFHSRGDITLLRNLRFVVAATNGSPDLLGAGVDLWHPSTGILYRLWFGIQACAGHSADAEGMAKIALLFIPRYGSGDLLLVTESLSSLTAILTQSPHKISLLLVPFRAAIARVRARLRGAWLPTHPESGSTTHLASFNAEADGLADRGASGACTFSVPWLQRSLQGAS